MKHLIALAFFVVFGSTTLLALLYFGLMVVLAPFALAYGWWKRRRIPQNPFLHFPKGD